MLSEAKNAFEKINHYRGLAMVIKLQRDLKSLKQMMKLELSPKSMHSGNSESLKSVKCEGECNRLMKLFREEQRRLQPDDTRQEMCISRLQGEAMALHVEIVRGVPTSDGLFARMHSDTSSVSGASEPMQNELKVSNFSQLSSRTSSSSSVRSFGDAMASRAIPTETHTIIDTP